MVLIGRGVQKSSGLTVPAGIILPYASSAAAPSGWTLFTAANNYQIRGAHNGTVAIAATTTGAVSKSVNLTSAGAHSSPTTPAVLRANFSLAGGVVSAGAHPHTATATGTATAPYKDFQLVKCNADTKKIPANVHLLSTTDLSGSLTQYESGLNKFLRSASSYGGTGGSTTVSISFASASSAGSHIHDVNQYIGASGKGPTAPDLRTSATGAHTNHSGTATGTLAQKYMYMTMWGNASAEYDLVANGIAMYESFTPPEGWVLCDGTSGTPDLRQNFVYLGTTGNHGTSGGTDTVGSWSGTSSSGGTHNHTEATNRRETTTANYPHASNNAGHQHPITGTSTTVRSASYALAFIMRAA